MGLAVGGPSRTRGYASARGYPPHEERSRTARTSVGGFLLSPGPPERSLAHLIPHFRASTECEPPSWPSVSATSFSCVGHGQPPRSGGGIGRRSIEEPAGGGSRVPEKG